MLPPGSPLLREPPSEIETGPNPDTQTSSHHQPPSTRHAMLVEMSFFSAPLDCRWWSGGPRPARQWAIHPLFPSLAYRGIHQTLSKVILTCWLPHPPLTPISYSSPSPQGVPRRSSPYPCWLRLYSYFRRPFTWTHYTPFTASMGWGYSNLPG